MAAGQSLVFAWQARTLNDAPSEVVYDFHSEEAGTDPEDAVSFDVGRNSESQGNFVAPFTGIHGWYWENRGSELVTVRLSSSGFYNVAKVYSAAGEVEVTFDAAKLRGTSPLIALLQLVYAALSISVPVPRPPPQHIAIRP